jgi:hemerythrin-like domain-containing protein
VTRSATGRSKSGATRPRSTASRGAATTSARKRKTAARAAAPRRKASARRVTKVAAKPSPLSSAATAVRGTVAGAIASVANRLPWASSDLDAIALLEKDHRRFEDLLKRGEETTERALTGRSALLDTLTAELNAHELVEEQILYPALKAHPEGRDIVLEGYQEHHVADLIVAELHALARDDERWGAKFKVLKESLEHHIQEEEGEMFRTARGIFSRDELQQMGARMAKMKNSA